MIHGYIMEDKREAAFLFFERSAYLMFNAYQDM